MKFKSRIYRVCILILVFVAGIMHSNGQSKPQLLGVWKETKKELKGGGAGEEETWDGKPYKAFFVFEFRNDSFCYDHSYKPDISKLPYQFHGQILSIANRKFRITKLTDKELILEDFDEKSTQGPIMVHFFSKSK